MRGQLAAAAPEVMDPAAQPSGGGAGSGGSVGPEDSAGAGGSDDADQAGDVALVAEGYAGNCASYLGLFERQEVVVGGRRTYKKQQGGEGLFLFYTAEGAWAVGDDTSEAFGMWGVASGECRAILEVSPCFYRGGGWLTSPRWWSESIIR